jgi:Zn-finger protein
LLKDRDEMSSLYRGPSIDASYQVSFHLAKRFQRRFKKNHPIRNKNCLWWPCLLMDRDKMSNLYRGPAIDASYQVSVHLAKWFQKRRLLRNKPIRNKNCLWWPCLLKDRDNMSSLYRGPSIDASYQVSVHLARRFQRRLFRNQPIRNKNCLWQPCL